MSRREIPIGIFQKTLAETPCQGILRGEIDDHDTGVVALGDSAVDEEMASGVVALHPVGLDAPAGVAHGFQVNPYDLAKEILHQKRKNTICGRLLVPKKLKI